MRLILSILILSISFLAIGQNSTIAPLLKQLKEAESTKEKMALNFQLAEAYLRVDAQKTIDYGKKAHNQSISKKDKGMSARSAFIIAQGYERKRNTRNAEVWLKSTLKFAKIAGYSDLIIKSVDKRSKLAVKSRNYRKAYQITQDAFDYFSKNGKSMSDLDSNFDKQKSVFDKQRRALQKEKDDLNFQINNLKLDRERLSTDKTVLEEKQVQLERSNQQKQSEISAKQDEIVNIEEEKKEIEASAKKKERLYDNLSKETIVQKAALTEAKLEAEHNKRIAQESKFIIQQSENVKNLSFAAAGFLLLLVLVIYIRYRSKRKMANTLAENNKIIEKEKERSEELLLNILPKSIAQELKEFGKAKAKKFTETTVLFTDFKNFTRISEQLTPEELVEELDYCFKSFDFIISAYKDDAVVVEKIKTIGDAYMCASGLTEERTIPYNIIRAAIAMQAFLEERKQERKRLGKPFFEARIGLHTGPVVAGVVGVNKFAYDIWGDTVNIAARMESKSLPGKVNISESTFNLVRYKFDCEYRGKVDAKNKGQIDMYFVNGEIKKTK